MDRREYNRVTEVLAPFSGIEFVPEDVLSAAADRGTKVHKYIEGMLCGWDAFTCPEPSLKKYVESFQKFWDSSKHAYSGKILLEERLYCDAHKITGQADFVCIANGITYVCDWKTSRSTSVTWQLQGAAYKYLLSVNGYNNVDNVLFVKLDKDGRKASLHKYENYEKNLDLFFSCLEIYRFFDMKNTRQKRR